MKSALYVAATVAAYRRGLDQLAGVSAFSDNPAGQLLPRLTNRGSSDGGLQQRPFRDSLGLKFDNKPGPIITIGQAVHADSSGAALVQLKQPLRLGQTLQALTPDGQQHSWQLDDLRDSGSIARDLARQESCAWVSGPIALPTHTVFGPFGVTINMASEAVGNSTASAPIPALQSARPAAGQLW